MPADLTSSPITTSKVQMPNTFSAASLDKLRSARVAAQSSKPVMGEQYREVFLSAIIRESPLQTRSAFDPENDEDDRALVESIESSGQREPAQLAEIEGSCPPEYAILDGHRRIAALRHLQRETVKAIIVRQGSQECDLISLTANVRKNLTPLELARAVGRLRERHNMTLTEIVKAVGLSRRYLEMLAALLEADPAIQAEVEAGHISAKTARVLIKVSSEYQREAVQVAADCRMSDVDAKRLIERVQATGEAPAEAALALGFTHVSQTAPTKEREDENPPASAKTNLPSPKRKPTGGTTLTAAAATAVLKNLCPELEEEIREALSILAVQRIASVASLKIAGLLTTAGRSPEEALKTAQLLEPHPHVRKILSIVGLYGELRDLIENERFYVEAMPLLSAVAKKVESLTVPDSRAD